MAHITYLRVTDLLPLKDVELQPNGKSVSIGGRNNNGKTSLQTALKMALLGKPAVPDEPVRRGAEQGEVNLELDNGYRVQCTVKPDRTVKLKVTHRDQPGFQTKDLAHIKAMFAKSSFDPGAWMTLRRKDQIDSLLKLGEINLVPINAKRQRIFEERTEVGRVKTQLEGQAAAQSRHVGVPKEEESAASIVAELSKAQAAISDSSNDFNQARLHTVEAQKGENEAADIEEQIARLQTRLLAVRSKVEESKKAANEFAAKVAAFKIPDVEAIKARLQNVEETNRKVRANKEADFTKESLLNAESEHARLTALLTRIDEEKKVLLETIDLPVKGLSFDEEEIRLDGTLWDNVSESRRWGVSVAMAFRMNPGGIVFMSQSGGLDSESRAAIMREAARLDVQLFMEVVDGKDDSDVLVIIEQGEVAINRMGAVTVPALPAPEQDDGEEYHCF